MWLWRSQKVHGRPVWLKAEAQVGGRGWVGIEDLQGSDHVGSKLSSERSEGQHQGSVRVG